MGFVKVVKTKAYFKRLQVKRRRRREGKTDYGARRLMIKQDKNKYNSPKYRIVPRFTNKFITCQITYATLEGDKVLCMASSEELPRYGIKVGLNNFAAAYATGLLTARRLLKRLGLEEAFEGVTNAEEVGEEFHIEEEEEDRRPFKCVLDIGLVRATVGNKVFATMKGAVDGGLHIPHSIKRFPGYRAPEDKGADPEFDSDVLKARIFGEHVAEYMSSMEEDDQAKYEQHFSQYIKHGIDADSIEDMYKNGHAAIRANPERQKKPKKDIKLTVKGNKVFDGKTTYTRKTKLNHKQRKNRVAQKIAAAMRKMAEA
jgi:large subunit ribosomal protein L5e